MKPVTIKLSKPQANLAAWALDPMDEWLNEESRDDPDWDGPYRVPVLRGLQLTFPDPRHYVVDDFYYRVAEQFPDMLDALREQAAEKKWNELKHRLDMTHNEKQTAAARAGTAAATSNARMSRTLAAKVRQAFPYLGRV